MFKRIMYEHGAGDSLEYLKSSLGRVGTRMLKAQGQQPDQEIADILIVLERIAHES